MKQAQTGAGDFLTRLASYAQAQLSTVEPRLASLFEPPAGGRQALAGAAALGMGAAATASDAESEPAPAGGLSPAQAHDQALEDAAGTLRPSTSAATPGLMPASTSTAAIAPAPAADASAGPPDAAADGEESIPGSSNQRGTARGVVNTTPPVLGRTDAAEHRAATLPVVDHEISALLPRPARLDVDSWGAVDAAASDGPREAPILHRSPRPPAAGLPAAVADPLAAAVVPARPSAESAPAPAAEAALLVANPAALPSTASSRHHATTSSSAAPPARQADQGERRGATAATVTPAPTIHVSIGRIEVRARQEAAAPARPAARRPSPLSLDDYLKGRGGGR